MPERQLRYRIDVDSSGATRELQRVGRAGRDAGRDIEQGFDKAESASTAALRAINDQADKLETELQGTVRATKALGAALGAELAGGADLDRFVADLRRMGVAFEDIETDAEQFAAVIRRVDGIKLDAAANGIKRVGTELDDVRNTGDQSRSVLANLAGNSAQSFGELGGVVGDLGVGLGQLVEYAVDGNIAMSNLAQVAGPMAGLAAAGILVADTMKQIAASTGFRTEEVERFAEAVKESGDSLGTVRDTIEESGELLGRIVQDNVLGRFLGREETVNAAVELGRYGVKLEDVLQLFDRYESDIQASTLNFNLFQQALEDLGVPTAEADRLSNILVQTLTSYSQGVEDATSATTFFQSTRASMIRSLSDEREQLWANERAWNLLFEAQHNGRISAQENVEVWNELRESLGLTEAEMAATFNDKYLAWSAEQADNLREAQEQADAFAANIADARNIMASADWGRADLEGAAAAYETYRQAVSGDRQQVADSEAAWDSFGDAVEGAGGKLLDLSTPEGRQVYAALDELATSIMPDLAQAFADSDGDIGRFRRSADILANQTLRRLQNEFNLSEEEAATLFAELGLLPEQITTFYELAGDEAARQKLDLLQGVIDGLPEDVQTEVAMHILADDPQAALAAVQRAIDQGGPLEADLTLDISQAVAAIARLRDALRGAQILAGALGINVQSSAASTAAAPAALMAAPATTAAPASAAVGVGGGGLTVVSAPPRPINVTVQAAVIGNRYDVQRAVTRAMRDADRIGQHA